MKQLLLAAIVASTFNAYSQQICDTLWITPSGGQDTYINGWSGHMNLNYGTWDEFSTEAWTSGGESYISRSLIEFDLSQIPANAININAELSLFHNPAEDHSSLSGSNACYLERITSAWDQNIVTWNTQPTTTTLNSVSLAQSSSTTEDYLNIDVSTLINDIINDPSNSFGIMLKLQTEVEYRKMFFASSDHADSNIHPYIVVCYDLATTSNNCDTLIIAQDKGQDTYINGWSGHMNLNYGTWDEFSTEAWTSGGESYISRSLIEFDLSQIPANAININAELSLFHNPAEDHSSLSGSNACYLERITSAWDQNIVTWNTQPTTTTLNSVSLAQSSSTTEDYLNIDVSTLINDIINDPSNSFGIMLKLQTEVEYRKMFFASSDHTDSNIHPYLVVCYDLPNEIEEIVSPSDFKVYPNPAKKEFSVKGDNITKIEIVDCTGKIVKSVIGNSSQYNFNIKYEAKGIYLVRIFSNNTIVTKKLIIQ